jgi:intracellular septation protein A
MRSVEFEMSLQPDRETYVVLKLPDIVLMFEEFFLRASVLKTNPHINNFKEKLLEIEKIIKNVIELVNEWSLFQRNFVYLNSIFCLDEITKSLTLEFKMFTSIQ